MRISDWSSDVCSSDLKYAVVSLADFAAGAGGRWFHPYLWARFAQPCRLAWCRDEAVRQAVVASLAAAVRKCLAEGLALVACRSEERRVGQEGVSRCRSRWSRCP